MLHRKYASDLSGADSLDGADSIHSLEDDEALLNHIEGSPYHCNLVPLPRPKKRPPKPNGKTDAYLSPQPWTLEGPNRSIQEDPLDTSLVASPGKANDLRVTPGLSPGAAPLFMPMTSTESNTYVPGLARGGTLLGDGALPQLMVTSPTGEIKARRRSEPPRGTSPSSFTTTSAGPPRNRRGTLPPNAVPAGLGSGPAAAATLSSAPQLRKVNAETVLAPAGRRRSSTNSGPPPPARPAATATPAATTARRTSRDGPIRPTPPTSRRTSALDTTATAPPAAKDPRRTSQNGRPPPTAASPSTTSTRSAPPKPTACAADADDKLVAAVARFNGAQGKPRTAAKPVTPCGSSCLAPTTTQKSNGPGHTPQLTPALSLGDDAFLFEGDLAGTMNAPYFGVDNLSASDKKLQPPTMTKFFNQQPSPTLADMLATTSRPAAVPPPRGVAPKRQDTETKIDTKAAEQWMEAPAQMTMHQSHPRRSLRQSPRVEKTNGGVSETALAPAPAPATKRSSVPPPSVDVPPASEHRPCEKAKKAKRLPPPTTTARRQAPPPSSPATTVQAPRQYQQRQLPQRTRGQSVANANPNDTRLVTLDDIRNDVFQESTQEDPYDYVM